MRHYPLSTLNYQLYSIGCFYIAITFSKGCLSFNLDDYKFQTFKKTTN
ncbi:MAG: hypothetical protein LBE12_11275 [Planctomycetaceae bacterium]|nr:hypothetical protein [Planctomycetaceae bacterium]